MTSWRRGCARSSRGPLQRVAWAGYEVVVTVSSSACKFGIEAVVHTYSFFSKALWGIVVAPVENQQALTDDTCARVRDRVNPHGHPIARLFLTNPRSA